MWTYINNYIWHLEIHYALLFYSFFIAFWMTTNLFATGCGPFLRLCRPRPAVSPREQPPLRAALGGKNVPGFGIHPPWRNFQSVKEAEEAAKFWWERISSLSNCFTNYCSWACLFWNSRCSWLWNELSQWQNPGIDIIRKRREQHTGDDRRSLSICFTWQGGDSGLQLRHGYPMSLGSAPQAPNITIAIPYCSVLYS